MVDQHARGDARSLTPAEAAVCAKVADGHTNREIAAALFVTVKAVEFHIHNAFLKLHVRNRTQLAVAFLSTQATQATADG